MPKRASLRALGAQLNDNLDSDGVHKLRTSIRRCESVINFSDLQLTSKQATVVKRLKRLRKLAGRTRDLDIQIGLLGLERLNRPSMNGAPAEIARLLNNKRAKQVKKLHRALDAAIDDGILKRADNICSLARSSNRASSLQDFHDKLRAIAKTANLNDSVGLHEVRIELKKLRYALEARAGESAESLIAELKGVHDAIGEWHDWVLLGDLVADHVAQGSPFMVEIRRTSASLFIHALDKASLLLGVYATNRKAPASVKSTAAAGRARA